MVCAGVGGCLWVECGCGGFEEVEELGVASSFGSLEVATTRERLTSHFLRAGGVRVTCLGWC